MHTHTKVHWTDVAYQLERNTDTVITVIIMASLNHATVAVTAQTGSAQHWQHKSGRTRFMLDAVMIIVLTPSHSLLIPGWYTHLAGQTTTGSKLLPALGWHTAVPQWHLCCRHPVTGPMLDESQAPACQNKAIYEMGGGAA